MHTSEQVDQASARAWVQPRTSRTALPATGIPQHLAAVLHLQRAAGNAAVNRLVVADPAAFAVQRCGSVPPEQCPCHGNGEGQLG